MNPLQAFRSQLGKLRRLAQPYFLPVEDTSGWQFLLLIVALLTVVEATDRPGVGNALAPPALPLRPGLVPMDVAEQRGLCAGAE